MSLSGPRGGSLIEHQVLANHHALSFSNQPYLKQLFQDIVDRTRPLTLVVGAGVSINAGLPSWPKLIDRIIDKIDGADLQELAREFDAEPLRRAEFVLQLARRKNVNAQQHEMIRDALYPKEYVAVPGQLAESLARLAAMWNHEVRIITTNFDLLLEQALERQLGSARVGSYGLKDAGAWVQTWATDKVGVLHVHGALRQSPADEPDPAMGPIEPVVLTQSHYLKNGAQVRDLISQAMSGATGLFVGLSLTDPNLIGPLYDTKHLDPSRYALTVADLHEDDPAKRDKDAMLAVESVRFLNEGLALRPIIVKSYAQVDQVVSDLSLALAAGNSYLDSKRSQASLRYGPRLDRALKKCYAAIGCGRNPYVPTGTAATKLTKRLRLALSGKNGPGTLLDNWTEKYGINFNDRQPERYGIHLWLRRLDPSSGAATYSLTLVGSSAFESKDPWYISRNVPIAADSDYAAAQALYQGLWVMANMGPKRTIRIWRGNIAVPIVLSGVGSQAKIGTTLLDRLSVGALTLTSTKYMSLSDSASPDPEIADNQSIVTHLQADALEELRTSLVNAASKVLTG